MSQQKLDSLHKVKAKSLKERDAATDVIGKLFDQLESLNGAPAEARNDIEREYHKKVMRFNQMNLRVRHYEREILKLQAAQNKKEANLKTLAEAKAKLGTKK